MKVGIDNYGLSPLNLDVLETLHWAGMHGAEGVAFSGLTGRTEEKMSSCELQDAKSLSDELDLFLEWGGGQHLPWDIRTNKPKDIYSLNSIVAEEAAELDAKIVRSCSGGLMRWNNAAPGTSEYLEAMGNELLSLRPVLKDLEVVWAIETHFEFTSFELIRLFEDCGFIPGEEFGICLDTMNLLTMLEDPLSATTRLLPWIVSTHIKDGGLLSYADGLKSFPAGINKGWIDLESIIAALAEAHPTINLNVEDHNGSFNLPIYDLDFINEFPDLDSAEMKKLLQLSDLTESHKDDIEKEFFDRSLWPEVCQQRMVSDVKHLKIIRDNI